MPPTNIIPLPNIHVPCAYSRWIFQLPNVTVTIYVMHTLRKCNTKKLKHRVLGGNLSNVFENSCGGSWMDVYI